MGPQELLGSVQNWWDGAAFGPHPPQPLPLPLPQAREGLPDACASKLRFSTGRNGFESIALQNLTPRWRLRQRKRFKKAIPTRFADSPTVQLGLWCPSFTVNFFQDGAEGQAAAGGRGDRRGQKSTLGRFGRAAFGPHPPQPLPLPLPQAREGLPDAWASQLRFLTGRKGFKSVAPSGLTVRSTKFAISSSASNVGNGPREQFPCYLPVFHGTVFPAVPLFPRPLYGRGKRGRPPQAAGVIGEVKKALSAGLDGPPLALTHPNPSLSRFRRRGRGCRMPARASFAFPPAGRASRVSHRAD